MKIKSKGIRVDKEGKLQLDKRCKEFYFIIQPERLNPEDQNVDDHKMVCDSLSNANK